MPMPPIPKCAVISLTVLCGLDRRAQSDGQRLLTARRACVSIAACAQRLRRSGLVESRFQYSDSLCNRTGYGSRSATNYDSHSTA